MPRLRFYNQRSRHEHSISTPPPETAYQASWVTPPTSSSGSGRRMPCGAPQPQTFARQIEHREERRCRRSVRGSTPDHLAVIRPPAAACLTARLPASVRSTAAWTLVATSGPTLFASRGRELRRFFGSPDPCRPNPLAPFLRAAGRGADERQHFRSPDHGSPWGTSMPAAVPRSRRLPSHGTDLDALTRALRGVLLRLAGRPSSRAFSPVCETPTRPLLALLSQDESRPRAPLRLLQVDVSTSTTADHSNISTRGNRGRDDCHGSPGSRLPFETAARAPQGQGSGKTDARHSRSRLLAPETSPQPRSLRAPGVARRHLLPVWSDATRWWRCQRRAPLQGAPAGRVV